MQLSPIEWTDFTSNPIYAVNKATGKRGHFCVKISPGCAFCYAAAINTSARGFGNGLDFVEKNRDKVQFVLNAQELAAIRRRKKPAKIFLGDMTDLFQQDIPDEYLDALFATMALSPQHTFQILTKRPERMRNYLNDLKTSRRIASLSGYSTPESLEEEWRLWPLPNVWLGVSAEDQQRADERIPLLLQTPAAVRFVSYEPALGRVNWRRFLHAACRGDVRSGHLCNLCHDVYGVSLDWIIVGGESGRGAHIRAFDIDWARNVVQQCQAAGVACFVKQFGSRPVCSCEYLLTDEAQEWPYIRGEHEPGTNLHRICLSDKGGDWEQWPEELRVRQFPEGKQ